MSEATPRSRPGAAEDGGLGVVPVPLAQERLGILVLGLLGAPQWVKSGATLSHPFI